MIRQLRYLNFASEAWFYGVTAGRRDAGHHDGDLGFLVVWLLQAAVIIPLTTYLY